MRLHVIEAQQWHTVCDSTTEAMAFVIVGRADWWVGVGSGPDVTGGEFALAPLRGRIRLCPMNAIAMCGPPGSVPTSATSDALARATCSVPLPELVGTSAKSDYVYFARH